MTTKKKKKNIFLFSFVREKKDVIWRKVSKERERKNKTRRWAQYSNWLNAKKKIEKGLTYKLSLPLSFSLSLPLSLFPSFSLSLSLSLSPSHLNWSVQTFRTQILPSKSFSGFSLGLILFCVVWFKSLLNNGQFLILFLNSK